MKIQRICFSVRVVACVFLGFFVENVSASQQAKVAGVIIYIPERGVSPRAIEYKEFDSLKKRGFFYQIILPNDNLFELHESFLINAYNIVSVEKLSRPRNQQARTDAEKVLSSLEVHLSKYPLLQKYFSGSPEALREGIKAFDAGERFIPEIPKMVVTNEVEINGVVYKNYTIEKNDEVTATITHSSGIARLDMLKLPEDIKNQIGFDQLKYELANKEKEERKKQKELAQVKSDYEGEGVLDVATIPKILRGERKEIVDMVLGKRRQWVVRRVDRIPSEYIGSVYLESYNTIMNTLDPNYKLFRVDAIKGAVRPGSFSLGDIRGKVVACYLIDIKNEPSDYNIVQICTLISDNHMFKLVKTTKDIQLMEMQIAGSGNTKPISMYLDGKIIK